MTTADFQALTSSQTNEWYTPKYIINKARVVMGNIDLDPASSELPQRWIKATRYYNQDDDGFNLPWTADTLWLNPPYGRKSQTNHIYGSSVWLLKAHHEYKTGNVRQMIILARGDSAGLQLLTRTYPWIDCQRISFLNHLGEVCNQPVPGTRIYELGVDEAKFKTEFADVGICLRAI